MSFDETLDRKRKDLHTLIDHVMQLEVQEQNGPVMNCVLSRLMAELRRSEVEEMRRHIMSCPGISRDSSALATALPALNEAIELIAAKEKKMQMSLLSPPALAASILGLEDSVSGANSSRGSSFSSDLDTLELNGGVPDTPTSAPVQTPVSTPNASTSASLSKSKTTKRSISWIGAILRTFFLDIPFATTVFILFSCLCARYTYTTFWNPVMETVQWNKTRMANEYTSYRRECDASDISTTNIDDVIIDPETTTPEEALDITNKHGMSIYPNILSAESAAEMRKWVLHRNANLSEDDEIPLISQEHRWSFPIGADEDPSVPPVLREIATNVMLQQSMDLIFGEDAAMVEFTAITSAYGAGDQHWHADNDFQGSQMHYGRSFVPMYSLFIPLQDTTAKMGATSACPGTHLCGSEDRLDQVCDRLNFQVDDTRGRLAKSEKDHVWKSGDGFLMHLNMYHRGPGHVDPNGTERVMLIMSISNRPKGPYFDRRQISLGTSYSNKWDMWGLTMKDLAVIDTMLGFPWKHLRALGIWKPKGNHRSHEVKWGWDHITVACSRIMNDQMGFRHEDLAVFVNRMKKYGPVVEYLFGYLPDEGEFDDETYSVDNGWREYFKETFKRLVTVAGFLYGVSCFFFMLISFVATGFRSTCSRFFKINAVIGLIFYAWVHHVSNTPWGKDIISGKMKEPIFLDRVPSKENTLLPKKNDILFTERLHAPFLANMNVIHDQQPGNANFSALVSKYSGAFSKSYSTPVDVQRNILQIISKEISKDGARVFKNDINGDWIEPSEKEVSTLVKRSLVAARNPILKQLDQEMKFLKSDCIHGRMRHTAMMKTHALARLENLVELMFHIQIDEKTKAAPVSLRPRLFNVTKNDIHTSSKPRKQSKSKYYPQVGDSVEYYFEGDGWFQGRIASTNKRTRTFAIQFADGEYESNMVLRKVRPFVDFQKGESVKVHGSVYTYVGMRSTGEAIIETRSGKNHAIDVRELSRP
jgi:hypothetical protein